MVRAGGKQKGKNAPVGFGPAWKSAASPVYAALPIWVARVGCKVLMMASVRQNLLGIAGAWTVLTFGLGGCTTVRDTLKSVDSTVKGLIEPSLPNTFALSGTPAYRSLSNIPEKPITTETDKRKQAVDGLTADRASTAEAADRLRQAPFTNPDPAPPPVEILP